MEVNLHKFVSVAQQFLHTLTCGLASAKHPVTAGTMSGRAAFIWAGAILVSALSCCRAPTLVCHFCFWFMDSKSIGRTNRTPLGFMLVRTAVAVSAARVATALDYITHTGSVSQPINTHNSRQDAIST